MSRACCSSSETSLTSREPSSRSHSVRLGSDPAGGAREGAFTLSTSTEDRAAILRPLAAGVVDAGTAGAVEADCFPFLAAELVAEVERALCEFVRFLLACEFDAGGVSVLSGRIEALSALLSLPKRPRSTDDGCVDCKL